ncbi:MAG: IS200/IS605 family transposase [Gammaproteobacteria bacterium]
MRQWRSQSHTRWYCRYHVVIVPKYRQKVLFGVLRKEVGKLIKEICERYGIVVVEGHVMRDHIHMCLEIPPKYSVSEVIGKLKGKTTILLHQRIGRRKNFKGLNFWSRGYCVSTIGISEARVLEYIRNQEKFDQEEDAKQMNLMEM